MSDIYPCPIWTPCTLDRAHLCFETRGIKMADITHPPSVPTSPNSFKNSELIVCHDTSLPLSAFAEELN